MDPVVLAIVKSLATSCLKVYVSYIMATSSPITYKSKDLGYKVPRWYMNPGMLEKEFYAYGTSTEGDEFQSLDKAVADAKKQMATFIRMANQKLVSEHVKFNADNIREKSLIASFLRNEGLEDYVEANATIDKKEFVKITKPQADIRAFVRIRMDKDKFVSEQEKWLNELKRKLLMAKTEDIMAELEKESDSNQPDIFPDEKDWIEEEMPQEETDDKPQVIKAVLPSQTPADKEPAGEKTQTKPKGITQTADETFKELEE